MIKDILILIGVLIAISSVVVMWVVLIRAPEGSEDETGFHYLKNGSPLSRPPFATKSRRNTSVKKADPATHEVSAA